MYSPSQRILDIKDLQTWVYMWHTSEDTHVHTPQGEPFQAKPHLSRPRPAKPNFGASSIKRTMSKPGMGTTSKNTHSMQLVTTTKISSQALCQSPPYPLLWCKGHMVKERHLCGISVNNRVKHSPYGCFLSLDKHLNWVLLAMNNPFSVFFRTVVLKSSLCSWISAGNSERSLMPQGKVINLFTPLSFTSIICFMFAYIFENNKSHPTSFLSRNVCHCLSWGKKNISSLCYYSSTCCSFIIKW